MSRLRWMSWVATALKTVLCRGAGCGAVFALAMITPWAAQADLQSVQVTQSPANDVPSGQPITFAVGLTSEPSFPANFVTIEILVDGVSASGLFAVDTALNCSFDGIYFCNTLPEASSATLNFTWSKPPQGASTVAFRASCSNNCRTSTATAFPNVVTLQPGSLQFSAADPAMFSVNEDAGTATITVTRSGGSDGAISVDYTADVFGGDTGAPGGGTATPGSDFSAVSGTLNWTDGETLPKRFNIPIATDALQEGDETFNVSLANAQGGAALGNNSFATITIVDVFNPGVIDFTAATYTVSEDAGEATISVSRSGGTTGGASVIYQAFTNAQGDTATAGSDYEATNGRLSWADGEGGTKRFTVAIFADSLQEGDETFSVSLSEETALALSSALDSALDITQRSTQRSAVLGNNSIATVTITDLFTPGTVQFSAATYGVAENDAQATISVTRTGGSDGPLSVRYSSSDGTASADVDYRAVSGTLDWADGDTTARAFSVDILPDTLQEGDETLQLLLSVADGSSVQLGTQSSATLTIGDAFNGGTVQFSQASYRVDENGASAEITVSRSNGSDGVASVDYLTADINDGAAALSSNAIAGSDYTAVLGTLTWTDGDSSDKTFSVPILSDTEVEADEALLLMLVNPGSGVTLGALARATLTITDIAGQPGPTSGLGTQLAFSGTLFSVGETGGSIDVTVTRSGDGIGAVSVDYATEDGSATAAGQSFGGDYLASSGMLSWADGEMGDKRFVVAVTEDTLLEGIESVTLRLANPGGGATLGTRVATLEINDNLAGRSGLNRTQRGMARALDAACNRLTALDGQSEGGDLSSGQSDLLSACGALHAMGGSDLGRALLALAPDEVVTQGNAAVEMMANQSNSIGLRIVALRQGVSGFNVAGLSFQLGGGVLPAAAFNELLEGGGASADAGTSFSHLGIFVNGSISIGEKDASRAEPGFGFDTQGLTLGADYRYSNNLVFGGALGYVANESDVDANAGGTDVNSYSLSAYGTYYKDDEYYIDGIASLGWNDYDMTRKISMPGVTQVASSSTAGNEFALSLGGGRDFQKNEWSYGAYGQLNYVRAEIDSYAEKASSGGAGAGLMLAIDDQSITSTTSVIGGRLSYAISTTTGVVTPQLRFDWEHEFKDDSRMISGRFLNDPTSTRFAIPTNSEDSDYFNLGLGVSGVFAQGRSLFLYYEQVIGRDNITNQSVAGGLRLEY